MSSYYAQLVERLGAAEAREYMKSLSAKRKNPGRFNKIDKAEHRLISGMGGKAKRNASKEIQGS